MNARWSALFVAAILLAASCTSADDGDQVSSTTTAVPDSTTNPPSDSTTDPPGGESTDVAALISKLDAAGTAVTRDGKQGASPFFSGDPIGLCVNGEFVQLIEYESAAEREIESSTITADGQIVAPGQAVIVEWVGPPQFFADGNLIALYLGDDLEIVDLLGRVLGPTLSPDVDRTGRIGDPPVLSDPPCGES